MKKRLLNLLIAVVLASSLFAQAPEGVKYQSVVRDALGAIIANQNVSFQLDIHQTNAVGTVVYSETHVTTTNNYGLVNLVIGNGTVVIGSFSSINWGADDYFLEVKFDPNAGPPLTSMGTFQLMSVPYALYSKSSGDGNWGLNGADIFNLNAGNVGVGTITPSSLLSLYGSNTILEIDGDGSSSALIELHSNSLLQRPGIMIGRTSDEAGFGVAPSNGIYSSVATSGDVVLGAYGAGKDLIFANVSLGNILFSTGSPNDTEKMTITNAGNIGIGTQNPNDLLHVYGVTGNNGFIIETGGNASSDFAAIRFHQGGNERGQFFTNQNDIYINSSSTTAGDDVLLGIGSTGVQLGNVGIGTQNPTAKLSVNGSANKVGGGSWAVFSDARLKKNINPYTDGLSSLLKIETKTFQYNGKAGITDTEKQYIGIIAQDMQKIAPYMVSELDYNNEKYLEFDPSALDFMMVNAIKELNESIVNMKKQIDLLQQENKMLKETILKK
jgi:hypothetical protein